MSKNKFVLLILLIVFLGVESYAQCYMGRRGSSKFSVELGGGIPILITPDNKTKIFDNYKAELGLRFLPRDGVLGVRGYYSFASLSKGDLEVHRFELHGIYMLDGLLDIPYNSILEIETYVGLGAAFGSPSSSSNSNKMIATTVGIRPRILIYNNRLHVYLDTSYGMLFNQKYDYAGNYIPNSSRTSSGSILHLSVGLSYRL